MTKKTMGDHLTWPVRMPNNPYMVFLSGLGFIKVPRGISFLRPSKRYDYPRIAIRFQSGEKRTISLYSSTANEWQRAIFEAAVILSEQETLLNRRYLRGIESISKQVYMGCVGLYDPSKSNGFYSASCQGERLYTHNLHEAAGFRLVKEEEYIETWKMQPEEVLIPVW